MPYVPNAAEYVAMAVFDPGANSEQRAQASHVCNGDTIPEGAVIQGWFSRNEANLTSAGAATLAISLTGYTGSLLTATAFNNALFLAGTTSGFQNPTTALTAPTSGGSHVVVTVAGANLSATGRVYIGVLYTL